MASRSSVVLRPNTDEQLPTATNAPPGPSRSRPVASVRARSVRANGARRSGRAFHGSGVSIALSILPGAALFAVFIVVPLVVVAATSFAQWNVVGLRFTGLDNYQRLVHDPTFWKALTNTALYAAAGVFVQVPLGVAVGLILAQHIRGWRIFRVVLFTPVVISGAAFALIFANVYNPRYGLLNWALGLLGIDGKDWLFNVNTALPAIAGTFVFNIGFFMILTMTEVSAIPLEVLDAGRVDGASRLQLQLYIVLPLLRHVTGTCVLLSLLSTLAFFDIVFILTSGGPGDATVTLAVYAFRQYTSDQWGYANAIGVFIVVTGFALILAVRRIFRLGVRDL
jgi:raffinose/stachyose/melibiose transport system permease protein